MEIFIPVTAYMTYFLCSKERAGQGYRDVSETGVGAGLNTIKMKGSER
jgi:hypothetical protein